MLVKRGNFGRIAYNCGAYANSKLAMNHCAKILAKKLSGSGVNVYVFCPGFTSTPFLEKGGTILRTLGKTIGQSASEVQ
jgi:NAD(P)-dependent dehydrogenase (short-subunit alcohol dehydrogenase family)